MDSHRAAADVSVVVFAGNPAQLLKPEERSSGNVDSHRAAADVSVVVFAGNPAQLLKPEGRSSGTWIITELPPMPASSDAGT